MIEGKKVVEAHEMSRIEGLAYAEGFSEMEFMENAGAAIAGAVRKYLNSQPSKKSILLLAGKGNNGGDAFAAGKHLLKEGYPVLTFHLFPRESCSVLCQKQRELFENVGGKVQSIKDAQEIKFPPGCIILDGIVGTGFQGKAEGIMASAIESANRSGYPILAIDIPSALNGNTGAVESVAIQADLTISLGLPKWGFFIGQGWNHVGELVHADFGLDPKFIEQAKAKAFLCDDKALFDQWPPVQRNRHKYQKGYVLAVAGSQGLSGAAILASHAVLRSGAGMVRLFYPEEMEEESGRGPLEVIKECWDYRDFTRLFSECKRAHALLVGPGLGRSNDAKKMLKKLLTQIHLPCVIDADALFLLSGHSWNLPKNCILTPRRKEAERLLGIPSAENRDDSAFHSLCQQYADQEKATLVLKGGPTFIFHPLETPLIITHGTPGLATAGTGDVLTGVLAAALSQRLEPRTAAALGVTLHGLAGEIAARGKTIYSMMASDVIESLPQVFLKYKHEI